MTKPIANDIEAIEQQILQITDKGTIAEIQTYFYEIAHEFCKKHTGENKHRAFLQEAIAFLGEEKCISTLQKTLYGNALLIFQKISHFFDVYINTLYDEILLLSGLQKIEKSIKCWNSYISSQEKKAIDIKEVDIEKYLKNIFSNFFFPEGQNSLFISIPSFLVTLFGDPIRAHVFHMVEEYLQKIITFLCSSSFRKYLLMHLYESKKGVENLKKSENISKYREEYLDSMIFSLKKILEFFLPDQWKKKLPFFPIRSGLLPTFFSYIEVYKDKIIRDTLLLHIFSLSLHKGNLSYREYSDDEVVVAGETWIEKKSTLEMFLLPLLPFSQEKLAEGMQSKKLIAKNFSPTLLAVSFSQQILKKSAETLAISLDWDENSPKFIRKLTRYILSEFASPRFYLSLVER